MGGHDWHDGDLRTLGLLRGEWLLVLHAGTDSMPFVLPSDGPFVPELDSTCPDGTPADPTPLPRRRDRAPARPLAAAPAHPLTPSR